jgi:hypothetical protein
MPGHSILWIKEKQILVKKKKERKKKKKTTDV